MPDLLDPATLLPATQVFHLRRAPAQEVYLARQVQRAQVTPEVHLPRAVLREAAAPRVLLEAVHQAVQAQVPQDIVEAVLRRAPEAPAAVHQAAQAPVPLDIAEAAPQAVHPQAVLLQRVLDIQEVPAAVPQKAQAQ